MKRSAQASLAVDLYLGQGERAYRRWREGAPALRRSGALRARPFRLQCHVWRAGCALAAARAEGPTALRARLLREVDADVRSLLRDGQDWTRALARLLQAGCAAVRADAAGAAARLREAIAGFEALGMALHAAAARRRLGALLGGEEGRALLSAADAWMADQEIRAPSRMTDLFAPGFSL